MSPLVDSTSTSSPVLLCPPSMEFKDENGVPVFDSNVLQKQTNLPNQFVWPNGDLVHGTQEELNEPLVDLEGFLRGDEFAADHAADLVRTACLNHGFFQMINHGVDLDLIRAAHEEMDTIFGLPLNKKLSVWRKPGSLLGYSGAHADRYSSKLPWKETFSFGYRESDDDAYSEPVVVDYFKSALGEDFNCTGYVFVFMSVILSPHCTYF